MITNKRRLGLSIAILSEGPTESWYFTQLKQIERVHIDTYPKEGKELRKLHLKVSDLIRDNAYDYIFGLIDMDVCICQKKINELRKLEKLDRESNTFYLIKCDPCFEYWFYLHCKKFSCRSFSSWDGINPLRPQLNAILPGYVKKQRYYSTIGGHGIYQFLRPRLKQAGHNSLKLFKSQHPENCQVFYIIGLIFCSKCKKADCSYKQFFAECLKKNTLCPMLDSVL